MLYSNIEEKDLTVIILAHSFKSSLTCIIHFFKFFFFFFFLVFLPWYMREALALVVLMSD